MPNNDTTTPEEIGESNAFAALDQAEAYDSASYSSLAAYAVNVVDTAREYRVNAERAMQCFLDTLEKEKK